MTPLTERNMLPQRGASFFRDPDGQVLFQFVVDTSNVIGPRKATKADTEKHTEAWSRFAYDETPKPIPTRVVSRAEYDEAVSPSQERSQGRPEASEPVQRKTLRLKGSR